MVKVKEKQKKEKMTGGTGRVWSLTFTSDTSYWCLLTPLSISTSLAFRSDICSRKWEEEEEEEEDIIELTTMG